MASRSFALRLHRLASSLLKDKNALNASFKCRAISTSKKHKDVTATADALQERVSQEEESTSESVPSRKNWISYGYNFEDEQQDRYEHIGIMLTSVTLCLVGGAFVLYYIPDFKLRDWGVREAYLQLAQREAEGKPLIDADLVPVDQIYLPTDAELGDTDIII